MHYFRTESTWFALDVDRVIQLLYTRVESRNGILRRIGLFLLRDALWSTVMLG